MKKTLLIVALFATVPVFACAKKPKKAIDETTKSQTTAAITTQEAEVEPTITEECLRNVSLVHENVKNKQFEVALEPWLSIYKECPNANKSIYTNGAKIVDYFYAKAKNENNQAEMKKWATLSLELCDNRIKYFGDDPKYPTAYILGEKALEYIEHFPEDELKENAYGWFKQSINGLQLKSKISVLVEFFRLSYGLYRSNPEKYGEAFIDDYTTITALLQTMWDDPNNKNASTAAQQRKFVDELFANSGAAECSKLDELYAGYVESNGQYLEDMLNLMKLYKRVGCTESDVYFAAAEKAHKMEPTEESAVGCAKMCMKKEDWRTAVSYYKEALRLIEEEVNENREDYLYTIAYIQYDKLKNYGEARTFARLSLEANPTAGRCYILIGLCYAATKPYSQADYGAKANILNKTVFWTAVDKFIQAKNVDPSCTEDANQLIATYSKYFPTKEERFDLPQEFSGATFYVGGWIDEKTVIR